MSKFMLERCYLAGGFLLKKKQVFVYIESENNIIYITVDGKLTVSPEREILELSGRKTSTKIRISETTCLKIDKKNMSIIRDVVSASQE